MKKVFLILSIYTFFVFAVCMGGTFFYGHIPALLPGAEKSFCFLRGLQWFLTCLPAILLSGFIVACSVHWQKNIRDSRKRFSQAMLGRYRNVLIISLGLVFVLSMNNEIFLPSVRNKIRVMKNEPGELSHAVDTASMLLNQNRPVLAWQYAQKATAIDPNDPVANHVLKRALDAVELARDRERRMDSAIYLTPVQEEKPLHAKDHSYSVSELVQLAKKAVAEENWFNAHYWANLAVEACSGTDTNFPQATEIASLAWNKLNRPSPYERESVNEYYAKKKEAYNALNAGDSLRAYYIFHSLSGEYTSDPDLLRFETLAREDVEGQFFFTDEVESIPQMANSHNIYFTLESPDGGRMIFFIKHAMSMRRDGGLVRYLDDVTMVQYTRAGDFVRSMHVPAAKVIFQSVSAFDKTYLEENGILKEWKNVPLLILQSVDRNTEGLVNKPVYSYEETGLPEKYMEQLGFRVMGKNVTVESTSVASAPKTSWRGKMSEPNILVLPMPYADFALLTDASLGPASMNLVALSDFITKSTRYGFAEELFTENFLCRLLYPLFMLVLCLVCAIVGWNYRIEDDKILFRFIWLLFIPLLSVVVFVALEFLVYFFNVVNFVIVGGFGTSALAVAFVIYLVLFVLFSIVFVGRKM